MKKLYALLTAVLGCVADPPGDGYCHGRGCRKVPLVCLDGVTYFETHTYGGYTLELKVDRSGKPVACEFVHDGGVPDAANRGGVR